MALFNFSLTGRRIAGGASLLLTVCLSNSARANSYGMQTSNYQDRPLLQSTIQSYASGQVDVDEMACTPTGEWIVVAGRRIVHSAGFPTSALAKVNEYVGLGLEIDVIAFAPSGGWMVIAEHLAWHSSGLSFIDTLEAQILGRINAGQRITELAFDADGSGWTLISGAWAYSLGVPSDLYHAILERHDSGRSIQQVDIASDGRWVLMADDWFASDAVNSTCFAYLKSFQRQERSLDRIMLGLGGNWVLFSNGSYQPDLNDPLTALEYGLSENLWQRMEDLNVAGLGIAVIQNHQVVRARGYGELEAGTQRFVLPDDSFDGASLSKFVTALGLMTQVDDGLLSLDSSALSVALQAYSRFGFPYWSSLLFWLYYGPSFSNGVALPMSEITLRRCLSHSASLRPGSTTAYVAGDALPGTLQMLFGHNSTGANENYGGGNFVWYDPTIGFPGTNYEYSAGGYMVAQAMAEALTLQPFQQQMQARVFNPIGMEHSTFEQPLAPAFAARAAVPHASDGSPLAVNSRPIYPWSSGGGLYASPKDLANSVVTLMNLGQAPNGTQVLSPELAQEMLTQQAPNASYGFGLSLSSSVVTPFNNEWFAHTGSHSYGKARLAGNPGRGSGIVIMISSGGDDVAALREEIYQVFKAQQGW